MNTTDLLDPIHEAREIARRGRKLQTMTDELNARRRAIIAELIRAGLLQSEVARLLDISRQRVGQYVDELRAAGDLPPACHDDDDTPTT